jgi:hypothetical protein
MRGANKEERKARRKHAEIAPAMADGHLFGAILRYSGFYVPEMLQVARFRESLKACRPVISQPASCEMSFCGGVIGVMLLGPCEPSMIITTPEFIYFAVP